MKTSFAALYLVLGLSAASSAAAEDRTSLQPAGTACGGAAAASSIVADAGTSLRAGDSAVVKVDRAPVMAGEQKIAELGAGRELRVERTQGDWLLTTVTQNGVLLQGWVRHGDVARLTRPDVAQRRFSFEPGLGGSEVGPTMGVRRPSYRASDVPLYTLPKGDGRRWSNGR